MTPAVAAALDSDIARRLTLRQGGRPTTSFSTVVSCLLVSVYWVAASSTSTTSPTVTSTLGWSPGDPIFPDVKHAPEDTAIPHCSPGVEGDCFLASPRPLGWNAAHAFCRSHGGFLVGKDKLNQLRKAWPPRNLTWLEGNLAQAVGVLASPVRNLTLHQLTWTAYTVHEGRYQWMSQSPAVGEFENWSRRPEPWSRSCAAFHTLDQSFHLHPCEASLRFYCLVRRPLPEAVQGGIELRVTANMDMKDGWVRVKEGEFSQLSLTCTAHDTTTGRPLTHQPLIFWSKDGVYTHSRTMVQFPAVIHDSTKSLWTKEESYILLKQGTFWCEAWITRSVNRLVSNKVLVTLDNWLVLILTAHRKEAPAVTLPDAILKIRGTFSTHFPSLGNYTIDPISTMKEELTGTANVLAKYRLQVHIPINKDSNNRIQELFQDDGQVYKELYENHGYLKSSSAALSTYCLRHTVKYNNGNHILWPFTKGGKVNPLNYRCEITGNRIQPGHCRWNYTHGATIDFDSTKCKRFDYCPHNYVSIGDDYCLSFTKPDTWEAGIKDIYKNDNERSILDSTEFHQAHRGQPSVYEIVKQVIRETLGYNQVWLPVKRLAPWAPLNYLGPGPSYYPYSHYDGPRLSNISWAHHHPFPDHDCLALDVETNELLTQPCNISLPFVALFAVRALKKIPDPNWKQTIPELIVENPYCPTDWHSTGLKIHQDICFKLFLNVENSTWRKAKEFCEMENAQLPSPSEGFLDWVYRQYLSDHGVDAVWMSVEPKFHGNPGEKYSGLDMINWKADTDYTLKYPSITVNGWSREGESTTKTNILCQTVPPSEQQTHIQVHSTDYISSQTVCITHEGFSDSLQCFVNGRKTMLRYVNNLECLLKSEQVSQGLFYCQAWVPRPLHLVQSNTALNRKSRTLTFVISLSQNTAYTPKLHDATFAPVSPQGVNSTTCASSFTKELKAEFNTLGYPDVKINADNFFYSPGISKQEVNHNFHVEFEFTDDKTVMTEESMFEMFIKIFATKEYSSECSLAAIKSTVGCVSEVTEDYGISVRNLTWPKIEGNAVVLPTELCVTKTGEPVTRECVGNFLSGYHWGTPSGNCTGEPSNVTRQLWEISKANSSSPPDIIPTLSALTANGSSLQPVDIHFVATKFQTLTKEETVTENDLEDIVETLNNVMKADDTAFNPVQNRLNSSSILFEAFENITFKVKLPEKDGDQNLKAFRELVSVERLDLEINSTIIGYKAKVGGLEEETVKQNTDIDLQDSDAAIIFPTNLTRIVATDSGKLAKMQTDRKQKLQLTFAVYRTPKLFQDHESFPNHTVNSNIIQATYSGRVVKNLKEPVKLVFRPTKQGNDTQCVYWDFRKNSGRGGWSNKGCWKGEPEGDLQVCLCNHLTCFAQLINYSDDEFEGIHAVLLDIITIIGCCLSIVSLLLVFTTFLLFKKWRRPLSNKILVNLSFSVFCSIVIFLAGIDQTWNVILCRGVAVALHYFILASFGWMLVEAVHQYLKFVKVVGTYIPRFMWKASVSAWGAPVLPIIVVLVYDSTLYDSGHNDTDAKICWMSSEGFIYAFLPPLVLTMSVNLIIFCLIIYGATCGRVRVTSTLSDKDLFISQLRMAICVFFLLGFTWIFGILAIWKGRLLFSYLFSIFNTLQGFFIFVFHVFRERSARRLWKEFLSVISKNTTSSGQVNSNNINNSLQYKGNLDSVTFNQGGEISIHPRRSSTQGPRGSVRSAGTATTLLHSRTSFNP